MSVGNVHENTLHQPEKNGISKTVHLSKNDVLRKPICLCLYFHKIYHMLVHTYYTCAVHLKSLNFAWLILITN